MNRNDVMWRILRRIDSLPPTANVYDTQHDVRVAFHASFLADRTEYREALETLAARCIIAIETELNK